MPSSPCSGCPTTPPPGLKSRQTTPSIAPGFVFGTTTCFADDDRSVGGIAVSPSLATAPAAIGFVSTYPCCGEPVSVDVDGKAFDSAPGETNQERRAPMPALTAPWLGSLMSITCQITPVAKSEIAIGMNTTVLNATAQR